MFGTFFEDLNSTIRDLEVFREALKNGTTAVQYKVSETLRAANLSMEEHKKDGGECATLQPEACSVADGFVCMHVDIMCCFIVAALVFGVIIGLWIAGEEDKEKTHPKGENK